MTDIATKPLSYRDFDKFGQWYSTMRRRTTGRAASTHTTRTKQVHLARTANFLGCPDEVFFGSTLSDRGAVERVITRMEAQISPGALRVVVYALLNFGDYAVANGWIERHEVRQTDIPPKNPQTPIVIYSPDEMELFMSASRGYDLRWWSLICLLAETGRRVGEALSLEWSWFRLDSDVPYVELPMTKNGEPQYLPLTKALRDEVFTPENIAKLKVSNKAGRMAFTRDPEKYPFPWTYGTIHARMARFCARVGLPNRGFHCFRHTVITNRIARGVPMQAVSKLAGHRDMATTARRYDHTTALDYARYLEGGEGE